MAVKVHCYCFTIDLSNTKGNRSKRILLACFNPGSGIQTAMRHDTIMEGGYADYALMEGDARRVAKEGGCTGIEGIMTAVLAGR
jgi:hypothetical protein